MPDTRPEPRLYKVYRPSRCVSPRSWRYMSRFSTLDAATRYAEAAYLIYAEPIRVTLAAADGSERELELIAREPSLV